LSLSDNFLWRVPRYGRCEDFATALPMDGAVATDASVSR
jgi:hypothetical protein